MKLKVTNYGTLDVILADGTRFHMRVFESKQDKETLRKGYFVPTGELINRMVTESKPVDKPIDLVQFAKTLLIRE